MTLGDHHSVPFDATQVLIVGAGPTGLIAANILGLAGVRAIVIERNTSTSEIPKGIYIDDEFFRTLDMVGLGDEVSRHCVSAAGVTYFSRFGFCVTRVKGFVTQNGYGNRSAIWQPELEGIMGRGAARLTSVTVRFGQTFSTWMTKVLWWSPASSVIKVFDRRFVLIMCSGVMVARVRFGNSSESAW